MKEIRVKSGEKCKTRWNLNTHYRPVSRICKWGMVGIH